VQLSRSRGDFWLVGVLALAVRLLHAHFVAQTPFFEGPVIDAAVNRGLALQLASHDDTGAAFYQPPLYAGFLSVLYRAGLKGAWSVACVQALLGAIACVLLVQLGRRLASRPDSSRAVGLVTGFAAALYGPFVLFDLELLPPCVVQLLLAGALLLALRRGPVGAPDALLGLVLGLATTGWTLSALFAPGCWWLRARRWPLRRGWLAALVVAAALLPLAVTARYNARHGAPGVVVSYNLGINLWLGNNERWRDTWRARPGAEFEPELERPDRHGVTTPAERSSYFARQVWKEVQSRPLAFAARTAEKLSYVFVGRELRRDQDVQLLRDASPVLRALLWEHGLAFPFGVVAPLALLAAWRRRAEPELRALTATVGLYALVLAVFFVSSRYRLPLVLVLLPLAVDQAVELLTARPVAWSPVGAVAACAVLANWPNHFTAGFAASPAERGLLQASAWRNQGRPERAEQLASELVVRFPSDANLLMLLAELRAHAGRCRDAVPLLTRTLSLAPRTASPRLLLADCYEALGDSSSAQRQLANALALHPYHPESLRRASLLLWRQRKSREARVLTARFFASGYADHELQRLSATASLPR
jgi:tetratricopeptide (TPR) repeat protein